MSRCLAIAFMLLLAATPRAEALTYEDLQGVTIHARVNYDMRVRRAEGNFNSQMTTVWRFKVDETGKIVGELTHTVSTPRGSRSRSRQMGGRVGKPGEPATGGHGLWLLEGNKLIALRIFDVGGFKVEFAFFGSPPQTCRVHAPYLREEGTPNIRAQQSVTGGPITILSAKQISSDCKVMR